MRTGWQTGFDSGESLDYIYENSPRGWSPLGRLIDRQYLNAIGWRGIRQRKMHLHKMVGAAIERAPRSGHAGAVARHRRRTGTLPVGNHAATFPSAHHREIARPQRSGLLAAGRRARATDGARRPRRLRKGRCLRRTRARRADAPAHGGGRLRVVRTLPRQRARAGLTARTARRAGNRTAGSCTPTSPGIRRSK